jgi:hypothetical protein
MDIFYSYHAPSLLEDIIRFLSGVARPGARLITPIVYPLEKKKHLLGDEGLKAKSVKTRYGYTIMTFY